MATQSRPSKLTLRLDSNLIDRAKRYARKRGTSVSQIGANYFQALEIHTLLLYWNFILPIAVVNWQWIVPA